MRVQLQTRDRQRQRPQDGPAASPLETTYLFSSPDIDFGSDRGALQRALVSSVDSDRITVRRGPRFSLPTSVTTQQESPDQHSDIEVAAAVEVVAELAREYRDKRRKASDPASIIKRIPGQPDPTLSALLGRNEVALLDLRLLPNHVSVFDTGHRSYGEAKRRPNDEFFDLQSFRTFVAGEPIVIPKPSESTYVFFVGNLGKPDRFMLQRFLTDPDFTVVLGASLGDHLPLVNHLRVIEKQALMIQPNAAGRAVNDTTVSRSTSSIDVSRATIPAGSTSPMASASMDEPLVTGAKLADFRFGQTPSVIAKATPSEELAGHRNVVDAGLEKLGPRLAGAERESTFDSLKTLVVNTFDTFLGSGRLLFPGKKQAPAPSGHQIHRPLVA